MNQWMIFILLIHLADICQARKHPKAVIQNPIQVIVMNDTCTSYTLTLDGSLSKGGDSFKWTENYKPSKAKKSIFTDDRRLTTNVTIDSMEGVYEFTLKVGRTRGRGISRAKSKVHVEDRSSVGMYLMASKIVRKLLRMQYQYISLSHHYRSAVNYHPRVAEYFRKFATDRGKFLDEVMTYMLAKQVTEDLLRPYSTDYVRVMMSSGFGDNLAINADVTEFMTSSFMYAKNMEKELGIELAVISHHAERNNDVELSDFIAADLLPRVTKVLNQHTNHLQTNLRHADATSTRRYLAEFLFDKYLTF